MGVRIQRKGYFLGHLESLNFSFFFLFVANPVKRAGLVSQYLLDRHKNHQALAFLFVILKLNLLFH